MDHNARIDSLVQDLILSVNNDLSRFNVDRCKRLALTTFANASSRRINQFEVLSRLNGLEEKARILNNDPLADSLHARLIELSTLDQKWTPELLSFLLQLSDRPVHEAQVEELQLLKPGAPPAPLTWSDIVAEDPLDYRDDIWKSIDFAADGSDDDEDSELDGKDVIDPSATPSLVDFDDFEAPFEDLIIPVDGSGLRHLESVQFWHRSCNRTNPVVNDQKPTRLLTETQAVREVIFMLFGLPTTLFNVDEIGNVVISQSDVLRCISPLSVAGLLEAFASVGTKVRNVRLWTERRAETPLEQKFAGLLYLRLADVDRRLSQVESKLLDPRMGVVPTLLDLYEEVSSSTRPIQGLDDVLGDVGTVNSSALPFRILECLFDKSCASQSVSDEEEYQFVAKLFFECFKTYLKSIRLWMEKGYLSERDELMFVQRNPKHVSLDALWHDQYSLIKGVDGKIHAPRFLHLAATKIFKTGKSVDFLRHMGYEEADVEEQVSDEHEMTFQKVCQPTDLGSLSPFSELFDTALDRWIGDRHHAYSMILREQLETQCGLQKSLNALEHIFFCRNGALSSEAAKSIFEWIDRDSHRLHDNFVLTQLFRNAYRTISSIDGDSLDVRVNEAHSQHALHHARRSVGVLENIRIAYTLPWSIANIVKRESMQTYQRVFILLLQIQRAKYLLQRARSPQRIPAAVDDLGLLINDVHHRLLWFVNTVLTYIVQIVISPTASEMRTAMRLATDVDGMIEVHDTYIAQLESRCFLAKEHSSIRQALLSLLDLAVLFGDIQASSVRPSRSNSGDKVKTSKLEPDSPFPPVRNESRETVSSDEEDAEATTESPIATRYSDLERLRHVSSTFSKLHSFVTAAVQGISRTDNMVCHGMLAASLSAGLKWSSSKV